MLGEETSVVSIRIVEKFLKIMREIIKNNKKNQKNPKNQIEEKKNALEKKIKRLRKEMDIVNKKVVAIQKYNQLKKNNIEGFEINKLKNYLLYYDLLDKDKQDKFILKAENYNERFTEITSDYREIEKICSQYSTLKKNYEEIQNKKDKDEHKH